MKIKTLFSLILSVVIVFSSIFFSSQESIGNLALFCVGLAAPESASRMISQELKNIETETATTVTVSSANSQTTSTAKVEKLTDIPDDILKLIEKAKINSAKDKKDGTIVESTYTNETANAVAENVGIKNTTKTAKVDFLKTLNEEIDLKIDKSKPAVLIVHTHTTEGYEILDRNFYAENYVSRTSDTSRNVARVGLAIKEAIESEGYQVIHDTTEHDTKYNGSYGRSEITIKKYLEKYPNIKIVLDVHRDAVQTDDGTKIKPVNKINGKKAAQIMLITGCQEQGIENYPDWYENLKFTMKVQKACEDRFPGLMRPVLFSARKYNMNLTTCSILVEVGTDANTLDEAVYSGKLFGLSLCDMLEKYTTK
ncbi:MAG: stage II sporulation protein P [Clostridia bacterium]|nr:stage II sporulation protein P [Clostridia bacterium]